jgi:shikimate kinase / 3-dehydroquinate synthase
MINMVGSRDITSVRIALPNTPYDVLIGEGVMTASAIEPLVAGRQVALVSNMTVAKIYGKSVGQFIAAHCSKLVSIDLPDGEKHKNWETLNLIFDALLANRFDRNCLVVALGGGVVGDMAGFAAASYQRGVEFVQIPTTLLSQVDSSVGGKTGINHPAGKNMVGAFHQPKLVLADTAALATLPVRELAAGLAEIIKHGAITDLAYLQSIANAMPELLRFDPSALTAAVKRSVEIKASVVIEDEKEAGLRATLNFGHTFGHAIESGMGYGAWLHGEAVGAGMVMAADLSCRLGLLSKVDRDNLKSIIASAGLPTKGPAWNADKYIELMSVDKKAQAGIPKFILLDGLGKAVVMHVDQKPLRETLAACTQ